MMSPLKWYSAEVSDGQFRQFNEYRSEASARLLKSLWDDPHVIEHGHEVGIAIPARHYVHMHVHTYASPGGFAEIQPHIDPLRSAYLTQNPAGKLYHGHQVGTFLKGKICDIADMPIRYHHKVT